MVGPDVWQGDLTRGAQGPRVVWVQDRLVALGYLSAAERATGPGVLGPRTERAIRELQRANSHGATGAVDEATHSALQSGKPRPTPPPPSDSLGQPQFGAGNPYHPRWGGPSRHGEGIAGGQCTWYCRSVRPDLGASCLRHAKYWADDARKGGFPVGTSPRQGAIAVIPVGSFGHVAYVAAVHADGSIDVSESNWGLDERIGERTIAAGQAGNYQYVYHAGE